MANIPLLQPQFQQQTNVEVKAGQGVFFAMQVAPGVTIVNGIGNPMMLNVVRQWLAQEPEIALQLIQELQTAIKQDIAMHQHIQATKNV